MLSIGAGINGKKVERPSKPLVLPALASASASARRLGKYIPGGLIFFSVFW